MQNSFLPSKPSHSGRLSPSFANILRTPRLPRPMKRDLHSKSSAAERTLTHRPTKRAPLKRCFAALLSSLSTHSRSMRDSIRALVSGTPRTGARNRWIADCASIPNTPRSKLRSTIPVRRAHVSVCSAPIYPPIYRKGCTDSTFIAIARAAARLSATRSNTSNGASDIGSIGWNGSTSAADTW